MSATYESLAAARAALSGGGVSAVPMTVASAARTIGMGAGWADVGGLLQFVAPAGVQISQIGAVTDMLIWDTGASVEDVGGQEIGLRLRSLTTPAGTSMSTVLWYGLAFASSAAAYAPASGPTSTVWHHLGRATANNSTCAVGTTNDNGFINAGGSVGVLDRSELRMTLGTEPDSTRNYWTLMSYGDGVTGPRWNIGQQDTDLSLSDRVLAVLGVSRSDTEALASGNLSCLFEYMGPRADWSLS